MSSAPDPGGHEVDQFELFGLWPIALDTGDSHWFTLWGDGTGDLDVLLAADGHLILARSLDALYAWVLASQSNVTGMPMGQSFLKALSGGQWPIDRVDGQYELSTIPEWLRAGWSDWSAAWVNTTLDSLNLLWDGARSVDNHSIVDLLRPDGTLGEFLDTLYEVEGLLWLERPSADDVAARARRMLQRWNGDELATLYEHAVDELLGAAARI